MSKNAISYKDEYYNHFSKKRTITPPEFNRNENFMMRFKTQLPYYKYDENSLTIIYFKDGFGKLLVKNQTVKVDRNKFIVSNPGYGWEYFNNKRGCIDVLSFAISDKLISKYNFFALANEKQLLNTPFERLGRESFFIEKIYNADYCPSGRLLKYLHKQSCTDYYQFMCPKEMAIETLQVIHKDQFEAYSKLSKIESSKNSTKIEVYKRLVNAYEYIHDNINNKITIEDLSHVSALSEYHLYNSFKKVFGKTPHQYIISKKMDRAKFYLETGDLNISEVASILSFPDLQTFSKLFKKTYKYSPKNFKPNQNTGVNIITS